MSRSYVLFATLALACAGCARAECPSNEVAIDGACFPEEALEQVGSGTPVRCQASCGGLTPHCDYRAGACAACALDRHCGAAEASRCDLDVGECSPCGADADCAHVVDAPICDVERGLCVSCTRENEAVVCGANSCDDLTGRCTSTPRRSVAPCGRCRATSECQVDYACVQFSWYGHDPESVCLLDRTQALCAVSYGARAPFVIPRTALDLRGEEVAVCEPPSTCAAWEAYKSQQPCTYTSDCGGPAGSTFCRLDASGTTGTCTMWCASVDSGYPGCLSDHVCDDLFCGPPPS